MIARGLLVALLLAVAAPARAGAPEERAAALGRGTERFKKGEWAAALADLERAHALDPADADTTLLLGITRFRLGELDRAEPLLVEAARAADADTAAAARIFLGLLAVQRGELDRARAVLAAAAPSPLLGEAARALARDTARRVSILFLLRPEIDSNVPLLPLTPTPGASTTDSRVDGDVLALLSLSLRPFRAVGLTLDETAAYRQQLTLLDYSLFVNTVGPGYAWLGRDDRVTLGYAFEAMTLGRAFFALGHVVDAAYRRRLVRDFGIGVRYDFHYRSYAPTDYQPFTGPSHQASLELSWSTPDRPWDVRLAGLFVREDALDDIYSAFGYGGRLSGHVRIGRVVELQATAQLVWRGFDVPDPARGERRDLQLYVEPSLGLDVARHVALIVGGSLLRNFSTVSDFDYLKMTAHLGVVVGWSGP